MIKNLLAFIGAIVIIAVIGISVTMGDKISKVKQLDAGAIPAYMEMFNTVLDTGDAAKAMILEFKVNDDISNAEVAESINALVENFNMRLTGDIKMFTNEEAKPDEVKHARIFSMCSLPIAKIFMNFSREYSGFMPCRVTLIEMGNGDRYLYTMDLTLMIYGGRTLPPEMLELAKKVQNAMETIASGAAKGDF